VRGKPVLACIGPVTEKTLRDAGYRAQITSREFTVERLAKELAGYFGKSKPKKKK
jgi:uroporphyrinogen-III synthase